MYDAKTVSDHYDNYGAKEWDRLDSSAHARLVYHLHKHFLLPHIAPGTSVLDAGCGAGRFAVDIARLGATVSLIDISEVQIALAKQKLDDEGLSDKCLHSLVADVCDLATLETDSFDTTVCYGGALNYLSDKAEMALSELVRVTKPGGTVLVSVMSRWGVFRYTVGNEILDPADFFGHPEYWQIPQVSETGDLAPHPDVQHPARHFFTSEELCRHLEAAGLEQIRLASAPSFSAALYARLTLVEKGEIAWATLLQLEEKAYCFSGLADSGEFLMARGIIPKGIGTLA
jgi:ubiquinone/menaquinone biosynthesis C-methylase UbiE